MSAKTHTPAPAGGETPVPGITAPAGWFDGYRSETLRGFLNFWAKPSSDARARALAGSGPKWEWLRTRADHISAIRLELELRDRAAGGPGE